MTSSSLNSVSVVVVVLLFVGCFQTSQQHASVSRGSAQTTLRAATLRQKLQIKLSASPGHGILTPSQPVPALTLERQAPGRVASGTPIFKSLVCVDTEKSSRHKRESNLGSSALEADVLPTRPARRFCGGGRSLIRKGRRRRRS